MKKVIFDDSLRIYKLIEVPDDSLKEFEEIEKFLYDETQRTINDSFLRLWNEATEGTVEEICSFCPLDDETKEAFGI